MAVSRPVAAVHDPSKLGDLKAVLLAALERKRQREADEQVAS